MESVEGLNALHLEVNGQRYDASEPEWGDATVETEDRPGSADVFDRPEQQGHVTVGLLPTELPTLRAPFTPAVLRDPDGKVVLTFQIEKISSELNVVVGQPLTTARPEVH